MALDHTALCEHAIKLELEELETIRLSPEFILALEGQLHDVCESLRPRPCDYEQRAVLVQAFNMLAKDTFDFGGDFPVVEAFGSFTMDLFTTGSDLDLSINFSNDYGVQLRREKKVFVLRKLKRFLDKIRSKGHISTILPVLKARVPVVKVVDSGTGIECDVSAENKDGILRSSILAAVSSIDERFRLLSYLMKAWAKAHKINSSKDRTMNSLSIISLVAFHLQTRDPPILPPFSALLKDGTDVSSVQNVVVGFKHFGKRNEEPLAKLFVTLLIKLSAVESLWAEGLCASTFEGSWIKKERAKGIGKLSVEDFLDRSENFARCVGKDEMKVIGNCIKDSLDFLKHHMKGETAEIMLKERLFGSSSLNVSNNFIGETTGLKRAVPVRERDFSSKRARCFEPAKESFDNIPLASTSCRNSFISVNPLAPFQIGHVEDPVNPLEPTLLGFMLRCNPQIPFPPLHNRSNSSLPIEYPASFRPGHVVDRIKPFEPLQSGNVPQSQYHPGTPFAPRGAESLRYQAQPPSVPHPDYTLGNFQLPFYPHMGYRPQHHPQGPFGQQGPLDPSRFPSFPGHVRPDQFVSWQQLANLIYRFPHP